MPLWPEIADMRKIYRGMCRCGRAYITNIFAASLTGNGSKGRSNIFATTALNKLLCQSVQVRLGIAKYAYFHATRYKFVFLLLELA